MLAPKTFTFTHLLIILSIVFQITKPQLVTCKSNDICHEKFSSSYQCDLETNLCRHSNLLDNINLFDFLGLMVILLFNLISFVMGVTANGVSLPILVLIFNFRVKNSLSALKMGNVFATTFNLMFILAIRHPENNFELAADFDLILFLIPLMTFGSMIGFLLFNWIPPAISYILILVLMVILTYRNYFKLYPKNKSKTISVDFISEEYSLFIDSVDNNSVVKYTPYKMRKNKITHKNKLKKNMYLKDNANSFISEDSNKCHYNRERFLYNNISRIEKSDNENESLVNTNKPSIFSLLFKKSNEILLTISCFLCLIVANLIKNKFNKSAKLGIIKCSYIGIVLFFLSSIPLFFIAQYAFQKLQIRETVQPLKNKINPFIIGTFCLIGGFISSVAVSGSLIVSCSLLVIGMDPLVVKCTIGVVLFGLTINNLVQFSLSNYADWPNALLLGCFSFFACLFANVFVKVMINKFPISKTNFFICLSSFIMTLTLCFAVPLSFYSEYMTNKSIFQFGTIW
jgi:uncharacterized membrane protein YfcA